jgi:hypothetical protein
LQFETHLLKVKQIKCSNYVAATYVPSFFLISKDIWGMTPGMLIPPSFSVGRAPLKVQPSSGSAEREKFPEKAMNDGQVYI